MRSLILYYTYHGNTQRIAERIHAAIGGDIARIDTVAPYTGDYDDVLRHGRARHARLVVHLLPRRACLSDCA